MCVYGKTPNVMWIIYDGLVQMYCTVFSYPFVVMLMFWLKQLATDWSPHQSHFFLSLSKSIKKIKKKYLPEKPEQTLRSADTRESFQKKIL